MPWKKTTPRTERLNFSAPYQTRLWTTTQLCTRFDISRTTGDVAGTFQARRSLGAPGKASHSPPLSTPHRSRTRRSVVGG